MVGTDKAQPIRLNQFHENDSGRAKNSTQPKQYGSQCICYPTQFSRNMFKELGLLSSPLTKVLLFLFFNSF